MGLRKHTLNPGVVADDTEYAAMGYAVDSQGVRIRNGRFESQGGYADAGAGFRAAGPYVRGRWAWADSAGYKYVAFGTAKKLYVLQDGSVYDITPMDAVGALSNAVATTLGSGVLTVSHAGHGRQSGDTVYLSSITPVGGVAVGAHGALAANAMYMAANSPIVLVPMTAHGFSSGQLWAVAGTTPLGGVALDGIYSITVADADSFTFQADSSGTGGLGGGSPSWVAYAALMATVVDADSYTVAVPAPATATETGGAGTLFYQYELSIGLSDGTGSGGFGLGGYSRGMFGFSTAPSSRSGFNPRTWSLRNLGNSLVANPLGGTIYAWGNNLSLRAVALPEYNVVAVTNLGYWNAGTNSPALADGSGTVGQYYTVSNASVSGVTPTLEGNASFLAGDVVVYTGSAWRIRRAECPRQVDSIVVTAERTIIALGCTRTDGVYDPTNMRWCDPQNPTLWFPQEIVAATGQASNAGEAVLGTGSMIMCGFEVSGGTLVWSDTDLYLVGASIDSGSNFLNYTPGKPIGVSCGPVGPLAVEVVGSAAYWLSNNGGVYAWTGGTPVQMPCPVKLYFLSSIDPTQAYKVSARYDAFYNAIEFRYPRHASEVNAVVRCDMNEIAADPMAGWTVGATDFVSVLDRGVASTPLGWRYDGLVCALETGNSANGAAVERWVTWAPMELPTQEGDGERVLEMNRIAFDGKLSEGGSISIDFVFKKDPSDKNPRTVTRTIDDGAGRQSVRGQGRQMGLKIHSSGTEDKWRLGQIRLDLTPVGHK